MKKCYFCKKEEEFSEYFYGYWYVKKPMALIFEKHVKVLSCVDCNEKEKAKLTKKRVDWLLLSIVIGAVVVFLVGVCIGASFKYK